MSFPVGKTRYKNDRNFFFLARVPAETFRVGKKYLLLVAFCCPVQLRVREGCL